MPVSRERVVTFKSCKSRISFEMSIIDPTAICENKHFRACRVI